jgi:hypothetical protein
MTLLKKFIVMRSPKKVCVRAYELFLQKLTVDKIVERLCHEGFPERSAARAVTFIPSAFARVHYEKKGIDFPEQYYPGRKACEKRKMRFYAEEPIFQEAMRLAEQLKRDGDWSQVWRIIEISAEHRGIAMLLDQGLTPKRMEIPIHEF